MGVEPTRAASAAPPSGFEDRAQHRPRATPTPMITGFAQFVKWRENEFPGCVAVAKWLL